MTLINQTVFISHSAEDKEWKDKLVEQMMKLSWGFPFSSIITSSTVQSGKAWEEAVKPNLQNAIIIIVLVSNKYLEKEDFRCSEFQEILEQIGNSNTQIWPIHVENPDFKPNHLFDVLKQNSLELPLNRMLSAQSNSELMNFSNQVNKRYFELTSQEKIKILVADDHEYAVRGLSEIIADAEDMIVVSGCTSPQRVEEEIDRLKPDIVLLDLAWYRDDGRGLKMIPSLQELSPNSKIIAISNYPNLLVDAEKLRVFTKDKGFLINELFQFVRDVYSGKEKLKNNFTDLTEREIQVLALVAEGLQDKEIADELSISQSTVKKHVGNIIPKLDANNRTDAAVKATAAGII